MVNYRRASLRYPACIDTITQNLLHRVLIRPFLRRSDVGQMSIRYLEQRDAGASSSEVKALRLGFIPAMEAKCLQLPLTV